MWRHLLLCFLPIKSLSDFSCGLKVLYKTELISYETESWIIIVPSCVQRWPAQFLLCDFSFSRKSCAYCHQSHSETSQWHEVSHKALLSAGSKIIFVFQSRKLFSGRIFTNMGQLLRLLSCKLLHTNEGISLLPIYWYIFYYMRVADAID
jgi:hypothetical protein